MPPARNKSSSKNADDDAEPTQLSRDKEEELKIKQRAVGKTRDKSEALPRGYTWPRRFGDDARDAVLIATGLALYYVIGIWMRSGGGEEAGSLEGGGDDGGVEGGTEAGLVAGAEADRTIIRRLAARALGGHAVDPMLDMQVTLRICASP